MSSDAATGRLVKQSNRVIRHQTVGNTVETLREGTTMDTPFRAVIGAAKTTFNNGDTIHKSGVHGIIAGGVYYSESSKR